MSEPHALASTLVRLRESAQQWLARCNAVEEKRLDEQITSLTETSSSPSMGSKKRAKTDRRLKEARDSRDRRLEALTSQYADLMFSYGLARLGALETSASLLKRPVEILNEKDVIHQFLARAFCYRIEQAPNQPANGPLPTELKQFVDDFEHADLAQKQVGFKIDRLREKSRILEPDEKIDAYRFFKTPSAADIHQIDRLLGDHSRYALNNLADALQKLVIVERADSASLLAKIIDRVGATPGLNDVRDLARRYEEDPRNRDGYSKSDREIAAMAEEYRDLDKFRTEAKVISQALPKCREANSSELVCRCVGIVVDMLASQKGTNPNRTLDGLPQACCLALQGPQLQTELESFLQRATALIHQGEGLSSLKERSERNWPGILRMLLEMATGWFYLGDVKQAIPVIDVSEELLREPRRLGRQVYSQQFALVHVQVLKAAPVEFATERLARFFENLGTLQDTFTTSSHFSLLQLQIVETVVLAALDLAGRENPDQPLFVPSS
jgi:hypothetical protein